MAGRMTLGLWLPRF